MDSAPGGTASLRLAELVIASRLERRAHERDRGSEIAEHELCADADDAEARALQLAIAASVRALLACVNGAIDLNDELDAWRQEIRDEEARDRHLAAKRNAELTGLERRPEPGLGLGEPRAVLPSKELEPSKRFSIGRILSTH